MGFQVNDQEMKEVRVIKDCWLEDHPGEQMEHEVVVEINNDMGHKRFRKYFINIDGYRKTYASGRFVRSLKTGPWYQGGTLNPISSPPLLVP